MSSPEEPDVAADQAEPEGPADDVRAKFRDALARKQSKDPAGPQHTEHGGSASGRSQNAKTQRMFRRKSG
jgi:hypothetical protein